MISRLKGKIVHIEPKYIILDVNGIGYKVFTTTDIMSKIGKDESEIVLWTYLAIRENAMDIYGFISQTELNFFELLITISGIGPKTALGILNSASVHSIQTAVQTGDTSHLTKVGGIGKKVADKIVMELKDKIKEMEYTDEAKDSMKNDSDALEALKSLGYREAESREVLKGLSKDITKTSDKIKQALKLLGK